MSKIEKALKKAQEQRLKDSLPVTKENIKAPKSKDVVVSSGNPIVAKHAKPNALIAEMEDSNCMSLDELIQKQIIFPEIHDGKVANSFRNLRTKLLQVSKNENFIILITSCTDGIESSFVSLNLSAAFSLDESKTSLIIDCNLDNPKIDNLLGITTEMGLTDYLESDEMSIDKIIHSAGIQRLRVISAGSKKESLSEYFISSKMKNLMDSLVDRYSDRYIFVDGPPVTDSADSKILMEMCDFVILAIPYGKVTATTIQNSINALDPEKFLGIVMNEIPTFIG